LCSDDDGEYVNKDFTNFFDREGITRDWTASYNPELNGVAERKNKTIVEAARAMMYDHDMPKFLWAEACSTAVYVHNKTPHRHWAILLQRKSSPGRHLKLVISGYLGV